MSPILRLEFAVTRAEANEAQELNTCQQVGGGSKWRTLLVLWLLAIGALLVLYFVIRRDVPAAYRPYVFAAVFVIWFFFVVRQRRLRNQPTVTNKVEISETSLTILTEDSRVTMPWSAFSQCLESSNLFVLVDRPKGVLVTLPRRAFPDEASQSWFRALAGSRKGPIETPTVETGGAGQSAVAERIVLQFQLGFRDYLVRTVASWRTWGIILLTLGFIVGIFLYSSAHAPPRAVYSPVQIFFIFLLPMFPVLIAFTILLVTFQHWQAHTQYLVPQEWVLSDPSINIISRDGNATLPWTTYKFYKETRWSFILWNPVGSAWMLLPKRAFASPDEVRLCRDLLARQLRSSTWFFG